MLKIFDTLLGWWDALWAQTWVWVGLIGFGVGAVELVARYRDNPRRAVMTLPALCYIVVNVAAGIAILAILNIVKPKWLFPGEGIEENQQWLYLILTAGFGAVALFRSSLFRIKGPDGEVAIGPSFILDTLLAASDRGVDRYVASPRGEAIAALMKDVSFERAKTALPTYCFALMQNVGQQEQKAIGDQVNSLANVPMADRIRALNLGLALINVVGERVLAGAIKDLGDLIKSDPPVEDREVAKIATLMVGIDFDKAKIALPTYCFGLVPLAPANAQSDLAEQINKLASSNLPQRVRSLILGVALAQIVGFDILNLAVKHLDGDIAVAPNPSDPKNIMRNSAATKTNA